ncbi:MAG: ricin-type beta-trefoil lectin domain protein [Saccharospirillaceae bacterium]|nr:ricin-type beta-trefoil lectin domain protein [Saccharospirillaceae bacterium]
MRQISFVMTVAVMVLIAACSGGGNSPAKVCSAIVENDYNPINRINNPVDETRDLDNDGIPDITEIDVYGSDPCSADSKTDTTSGAPGNGGLVLGLQACYDLVARDYEPSYRLNNPVDKTRDLDGDGYSDYIEIDFTDTDPCVSHLKLPEGTEKKAVEAKFCAYNINSSIDTVNRTVDGAYPVEKDSDKDNIPDIYELFVLDSDPCNELSPVNAEADNSSAAYAVCTATLAQRYDPIRQVFYDDGYKDSDSDNDGVTDYYEFVIGANPCISDSGIADASANLTYCRAIVSREYGSAYVKANGLNTFRDLDNDLTPDYIELDAGTDPCIHHNEDSSGADTGLTASYLACSKTIEIDFSVNNSGNVNETRDLDNDGLTDAFEMNPNTRAVMSLDACAIDSDSDGLGDYHEAVAAGLINGENYQLDQQTCKGDLYYEGCDTDGDKLTDLQETYGYYYPQPGVPVSVPRYLPQAEFLAMAETAVEGLNGRPNPWKVATEAIRYAGLAELRNFDNDPATYISVNAEKARAVIASAFVNSYPNGADTVYLTGTTATNGSLANIIKTLFDLPVMPVTDNNGEYAQVYYTNPALWSSDWDPYSDFEESSRVNSLPNVTHPADHPLVAGSPVVKVKLVSMQLIEKTTEAAGTGEEKTENSENLNAESATVTHGWNTSVSLSYGKDGFGGSVTAGYSGSVADQTYSSTMTGESTTEKTTYTDTSAKDCEVVAWLTVVFENYGTAALYDFMPKFTVHIGAAGSTVNEQYTFYPGSVDRVPSNIEALAPGAATGPMTYPTSGAGTRYAQFCITKKQKDFIADGGMVTLDVVPSQGKVAFWDNGNKKVITDGSWAVYESLIRSSSSVVDVEMDTGKLIDGKSVRITGRYHVSVNNHSNVKTLGDALKLLLTSEYPRANGLSTNQLDNCPSSAERLYPCYDTLLNRIHWGTLTDLAVSVYAVDDTNKPIPYSLIPEATLSALARGDLDSVPLMSRWRYSIINASTLRTAQAGIGKVYRDDNQYSVTTWAFNTAGKKLSAQFCINSDDCTDMQEGLGFAASALFFTHALDKEYTFKGTEFVRIIMLQAGDESPLVSTVSLISPDISSVGENTELDSGIRLSLDHIDSKYNELNTKVASLSTVNMAFSLVDIPDLWLTLQSGLALKHEIEDLQKYCKDTNKENIYNGLNPKGSEAEKAEAWKAYQKYLSWCMTDTRLSELNKKLNGIPPEYQGEIAKINAVLTGVQPMKYYVKAAGIGGMGNFSGGYDYSRDCDEDNECYYDAWKNDVSCSVGSDRVISSVRISAGIDDTWGGRNRLVYRHIRQIKFKSWRISAEGSLSDPRDHNCEVSDDGYSSYAFHKYNVRWAEKSVDANIGEYITDIAVSIDDTQPYLCVKYAKIDKNSPGGVRYAGQKGERCSNPEKTSWYWWADAKHYPNKALRELHLSNTYSSGRHCDDYDRCFDYWAVDKDNVRNLASWYNEVIIAKSDAEAKAETITWSELKDERANLCLDLDSNSSSDGANIKVWGCNGNNAQKWFHDPHTGHIVNINRKCLDIPGNDDPNSNRNVQQWTCDTNARDQQWRYDGKQFINRVAFLNTSHALDAVGNTAGSNVIVHAVHNGLNQRWYTTDQTVTKNRNIEVRLGNSESRSLCLDVPGGSVTNGQYLKVWSCNSNKQAQGFYYDEQYQQVKHKDSEYCLSADNIRVDEQVRLRVCNSADTKQKWIKSGQHFASLEDPAFFITADAMSQNASVTLKAFRKPEASAGFENPEQHKTQQWYFSAY